MVRINLELLGHPRLSLADGTRIALRSKKGFALLALLATAETAERSRSWLQQKLWGSRNLSQAQTSLRRELANLRQLVPLEEEWLLGSKHSIRLNLDLVKVDIRDDVSPRTGGEFLEGLDIAGEDDFEDWLRVTRGVYAVCESETALANGTLSLHSRPSNRRGRNDFGPDSDDFLQNISTNDMVQFGLTPIAPARKAVQVWQSALEIAPIRGLFLPPEDEHLLESLGRLLVNAVTRMRWLPVVAPSRDQPALEGRLPGKDTAPPGRYLLETELVRSGDHSILSFSLVERPDGQILWSDSESIGSTLDTLELEPILHRAVNYLAARFDRREQQRALAIPHQEASVSDLVWCIRHHLQRFTREDMAMAAQLIELATTRDPHHTELTIMRANHVIWDHWLKRVPFEQCNDLFSLARAAMRADPADARGPLFMGVLETWRRNTDHAIRYLERSCELNPSLPAAFAHLGAAYYLNGMATQAIAPLEQALYLSVLDPFRFFIMGELGTAKLLVGDHTGALKIAQEVQMTHPNYVLAHILETNAHVALGDLIAARRSWQRLLAGRSDLYEGMLGWIPFREDAFAAPLRQGCDLFARYEPEPDRAVG